ncbi:hypothetical protein A2382_03310 [Candidatus Woesebacteria bacterium RIFOXYB1_FULL_38_16]|uniref:Transglutaminase-like domain-containing protein n=1 Tax=Candidatus Woesebacteria bacterium RIFOXYB1_FULL_38_16 TaxID=1802538 RepID=A0A1F8CTU9_9BACT|nr:MAG: hypothetical protein A2191_04145 [Candidatus Woesebacteria bacterium RIFOXYA1_FULL_38_9]OGM79753.1 MAG: hypothetical protein A2382_03310 [Candidatus Woesebacteria bacterium RIFOXYB1_FULL_38_16]
MTEEQKYLLEGEQTKITSLVKKHAEKAKEILINIRPDLDPNLILAEKVAKYILTALPEMKGYKSQTNTKKDIDEQRVLKDSLFRKRTANQLLIEGYYPTCSDIGILFRTLMIALGVSTAYVETFHEDYLLGKAFHGHVVGKIFSKGKWYFVDPQNNKQRISKNKTDLFPLIIYKEGLDSWDIKIKGYEDMHKAKKENLNELIKEYKRVIKNNYENKIKMAGEVMKNPSLAEIK